MNIGDKDSVIPLASELQVAASNVEVVAGEVDRFLAEGTVGEAQEQ